MKAYVGLELKMHGFMLFMGDDSKFIRGEEFGDISSEGESVGEDVINTFNSVTEDSSSSCLWMQEQKQSGAPIHACEISKI